MMREKGGRKSPWQHHRLGERWLKGCLGFYNMLLGMFRMTVVQGLFLPVMISPGRPVGMIPGLR